MKLASRPILEYLQKVNILEGLTKEEIALLFKPVQSRECPSGTLLFTPDDRTERLFILKVGRVDVYRLTPAGKRLVVDRLGPGTIFGEMGLIGQSLQGCFAEATEQSLLCVVTRDHLLEVLRQRPDVAIRLLEVVGKRAIVLEERLEQALFSPVKARLASFLLASMDPSSGTVADYTHEDIGDTIGALRQTVTETLRLLHDQGLVEVGRKQIRVMDRGGLAELANGGA